MSPDLIIHSYKSVSSATIHLPVSKSECNRALVLSFLSNEKVTVKNISESEDTRSLQSLLAKIKNGETTLDCGAAGTTFRFLTALLSITEGKFILTGSARMKERPVKELVNALLSLGADIRYLENTGFPPLSIQGKKLQGGEITIDASFSSQYTSALMMIAPKTENGLTIQLAGKPVSFPYIIMTAGMMRSIGCEVKINKNTILVSSFDFITSEIECENDWSAASYFYSMAAVKSNLRLKLTGLKKNSLQGDKVLDAIYSVFGIETVFTEEGIEICNNQAVFTDYFEFNFMEYPDLAQTVAFTCAALRISGKFSGLQTLTIKETDRLAALKNELEKCNMECSITNDSIRFEPSGSLPAKITFDTYQDHRMAMAASVMAFVCDEIIIKDKEVVKKSFPDFWKELKKILSFPG